MRTPARGTRPAKAQPVSFPAPTGGWIANRSLAIARSANLPPGAAILDNWFPTSTGVVMRRGRELKCNIGTAPVRSMFRYVSGAQQELFASMLGPIYDVSTTSPSLARPGGTDGEWITQQITTSGGTFLIGVNGVDTPWIYDGTSFAATTITFPVGSPVTLDMLSYVWLYAQRLWFIQRDSMSVWYLPVDSIGGALTELPLGGVFTMGGTLEWGNVWSLGHGGSGGLSEQIVFTSTSGEVLAYQGSNPDSATDFARVGLYRIGEPMGQYGHVKAGGDVLIATSVGLTSLSKASNMEYAALGSAAASYPIEEVWTQAVQRRGLGDWRVLIWPEGKMVVVAPPPITGEVPATFIANSNTGAWCRFTNWDIRAMEVFAGFMQFGDSAGNIWVANVTGTDAGQPFTATCLPLFEDVGAPANRKIMRMGRCVLRSAYPVKEKLTARYDFDMTAPTAPDAIIEGVAGLWGSGVWGSALWGQSAGEIVTSQWKSMGGSGQDVSLCLQVSSGAVYPLDTEVIRIDGTVEVCGVIS